MKIRHPEKINKPINPIKRKPDWIRSKITNSREFFVTKSIVNKNNLRTVCQEANCPNITDCWSKKHATFLIMGETCTRACAFCDVATGKPTALDYFEPYKIAEAINKLKLKHVVITSVNRGYNHMFQLKFIYSFSNFVRLKIIKSCRFASCNITKSTSSCTCFSHD